MLTPKDRVLLLSALSYYRLELQDQIKLYDFDKELQKATEKKLEQAIELYESNRLI